MKDQLNAEIKRFADLCAKVRPGWAVDATDLDDGTMRVNVDCDQYEIGFRADCAAFVFWLLEKFEVDLEVYRFWNGTACRRVSTSTPAKSGYFAGCTSDDAPLHHVVLLQVLLVVNAILDHEAEKKEAEVVRIGSLLAAIGESLEACKDMTKRKKKAGGG